VGAAAHGPASSSDAAVTTGLPNTTDPTDTTDPSDPHGTPNPTDTSDPSVPHDGNAPGTETQPGPPAWTRGDSVRTGISLLIAAVLLATAFHLSSTDGAGLGGRAAPFTLLAGSALGIVFER